MALDRRSILAAGLGIGATGGALGIGVARAAPAASQERNGAPSPIPGLVPDSDADQTAVLQSAIDAASSKDQPLYLPPGVIRVRDLRLRQGTRLIGAARTTVLKFAGGSAFVTGDKADGLVLDGIVFDGTYKLMDDNRGEAIVAITNSKQIEVTGIDIRQSTVGGLSLTECSGRISNAHISDVLGFGIKSLDAVGLDISHSTVANCGNNGILIWRSGKGEDGTTVTGNRISKIRNAAGGTGEYGNGINVFRASSVIVAHNRISDCAYTAVRGNAADNIQIVANSCERLGEVAIYSEFGFAGALIAGNVVDKAATGISVTNFDHGGRLAVIQGNLIRNLFRREHEPVDKRGEGIGIEADATVTGNTIEGAPSVGIQVGWGRFMRDVAVTGNVVRQSRVGISISSANTGGACLVANNLIAKTEDGAIRRATLGEVTGPDLAREPANDPHLTISGNVAA